MGMAVGVALVVVVARTVARARVKAVGVEMAVVRAVAGEWR